MDLEYDSKFEEMKKYIPFLENMIKRLENTSNASSNPRQAQLDKIRSLRNLLLDNKKRMKMENLLKCEQVLVNLYAKVEQKDALPNQSTLDPMYSAHSTKKEEKDLDIVRKKLKSVATILVPDSEETLPEISRASEIEEICTKGSKEPALFQRRPNKSSLSPSRACLNSPCKSGSLSSKRNYTRVLVSPEPDSRCWDADDDAIKESPLFSRRSPTRKSLKERYSPSRERKKERRKGLKQGKLKKTEGLNITLNVPEESLDSLNTEDILSRIMNCNDNDMDIETLREAKRQILSELKQTGAKYDDISDLLLKSYKNKSQGKKKDEVEEGELSDSESEAIESIYGGLNSSQTAEKTIDEKEQPRKIQICLVINSEEGKASDSGTVHEPVKQPLETDASDFEMFAEKSKTSEDKVDPKLKLDETKLSKDLEIGKENIKDEDKDKECNIEFKEINNKPANFYKPLKDQALKKCDKTDEKKSSGTPTHSETESTNEKTSSPTQKIADVTNVKSAQDSSDTVSKTETKEFEIPLLHETAPTVKSTKKNVSEIDILQALKNEILSESLSIPSPEAVTPALHQPKLKKVANAQEIVPKKRISIEKYKEKSVLTPKPTKPLFIKETMKPSKDDSSKKQSLKLTMKECERFNVPIKVALNDDRSSSDGETDKNVSLDDIYSDIAPKSPDNDDSSDVPCTPPIIIPVDPVKVSGVVVPVKRDIDMRTFPLLPNSMPKSIPSPVLSKDVSDGSNKEVNKLKDSVKINLDKPKLPSDPRMRREQSINSDTNPFPLLMALERGPLLPTPSSILPNMAVNRGPNMTPIRNPSTPNMTPSMTPNARTFEIDENAVQKHVYAPLFTPFDSREIENSMAKDPYQMNPEPNKQIPNYKPEIERDSRRSRWDSDARESNPRKWDDRDPRSGSIQRESQDYQRPTAARYSEPYKPVVDYNYRKNSKYTLDRRDNRGQECPQTSVHPFGRSDCSPTPSNQFGIPSLRETPLTPVHPFGRSDCPLTPSHPFGRSDCPPTPIHPFGRNDCPMTPSHPFGRSDCPGTPSHPFGRSDCPTTPSHPFGRSDCPTTPSHLFGRGDVSMTLNHQFGRSDNIPRDPRLNRSSDYDKYQKNDRKRSNYYRDRPSFDGPDNYRPYRDKGDGRNNDYRNERYNKYSPRDSGGQFNRESMPLREPSVGRGGRAVSRDTDNERIYTKDRNYGNKHDYYSENENSKGSMEFEARREFYRERSVGRSAPEERTFRSSPRAPSVGRTFDNEKNLSVKRATGRSFTIDTSVNSTFQEFLNAKNMQVIDYSFDNRRKRAASVGRSLARESSVTKLIPQKPKETFESFKPTKRLDFRRASSMGREIVVKEERTFKDIKADFESFKAKIVIPNSFDRPNFTKKEDKYARDIGNGKSKKDAFDSRSVQSSRKQYSPRKNNRDPRVRKEYNEGSRSKFDERNRKHAGIVYSNANITKGTILGSGYGVKNYKIPKIKRHVEEIQSVKKNESQKKGESDKTDVSKVAPAKTDIDKKSGGKNVDKKVLSQKKDLDLRVEIERVSQEKNIDESVKNSKQIEKLPEKKTKDKKTTVRKKSVDSLQNMNSEIVEKRVTRLSRKSETVAQPLASAKVKSRKAVIYDSESEEETSKDSTQKMVTDKKDTCLNKSDEVSNATDENTFDSQSGEQIDSSFGIDDLEIFSDNIVSDPVIDNINELIADLDNELGPTKIVTPTDFSNDIIENMLESITNAGKEDTKSLNEDDKLNDISEVINNDLNQSVTSLDMKDSKTDEPVKESVTKVVSENVNVTIKETNKLLEMDSNKTTKIPEVIKIKDDVKINDTNNDDVVTTTDTKIEQTTTDKVHQTPDKSEDKKEDHSDVDGRSTPDSTINSVEVTQNILSQESLPDSTNEAQNDANSIVSSTHDSVETLTKDNVEPTSSNKDAIPSLNSIGSILDLLQNKSKIKELLSQLGNQASDNEKIKKKLEKLSEIVSDEEEEVSKDCGDNVDEIGNETKKDITEKDKISADTLEKKETIADEKNDLKDKIDELNNETQILDTNETQNNEMTKSTEVTEDVEKVENNEKTPEKVVPKKKSLQRKRGKGRKLKKGKQQNPVKRVTRSNMDSPKKPIVKKQSRELLKLQNDIKEMFMKDEILNATGIRMCRLAKLVDGKKDKEEAVASCAAPMVVTEKDKGLEDLEETLLSNKLEKKKGILKPKGKPQVPAEVERKLPKSKPPKYKPGPKSKKKHLAKQDEGDPYEFESDSVSDMTIDEMNYKSVDGKEESSDSDSESLASSKSFGSSEVLSELKKKPKRKRSSWQSGIIKARNRKKKADERLTEASVSDIIPIPKVAITIPDLNCFTDKSYCFRKNVTTYSCRLCVYSGDDIVAHYKENHPHSEIPLSRMDPLVAKEAIEQCEEINFQAISKIPTDKYICRFCYKVFLRNKRSILEAFFWHIVSMHTGEYKKLCSECVNVTICPFNLDIPPPPKDIKGQLIGYICEKCNFTQISLENLKTHVIVRHNDEQTEVYTINLAVMSRKTINTLLKRVTESEPRVLRSTRSNQSMTETSDDHSDITDSEHASEATPEPIKRVKKGMASQLEPSPYQTKITYENEDSHSETSHVPESENIIKIKNEFAEESKEEAVLKQEFPPPELDPSTCEDIKPAEEAPATNASDDIFDYPHFKKSYTDAGLKEYVCCINGKESHYKTTLLISMKKHVQTKHTELWDGYCFICKVIVTPQGQQHSFKECLQHILDNHMDNFPVLEKVPEIEKPVENPTEIKPYINVRPLSELISVSPEPAALPVLPKIESIVSLGVQAAERVASPSAYQPVVPEPEPTQFQYEEVQAEVMSKKHQVVLDSMMSRDKLINVYKCAGRYCSFTSDSVEDALLHASTHNRVGGEGSLSCAYCSFDCSGNAIDLVMHVFKSHGTCPYVCGYCFYRSAAPQLVVAHSGQRHSTLPPRVLASTQPPSAPAEHAMLQREVVVQYYVCPHACKYRTYTAQKFCEHLAQRHAHESVHPCYICSETTSSGVDLIQHMKAHDLNVYQCTWCTHGAASEAQLLAHAAAAHPARQPQAYLRLITSKEGTKEFRVLPLASFNKTKIYVEKASPSTNKDNPVREAERSIELESLIGHTNQTIGTATTSTQPPEKLPETTLEPPSVKDPTDDYEMPTVVDRPSTLTDEELSRVPTPILKIEPTDTETPKDSSKTDDVVYCLDSDEEEPKQNEKSEPETPEQKVIDLSDEDILATDASKTLQTQQTQTKFEKLPFDKVLKCPQCFGLFKNVGGFKKHTMSCLASIVDPVACAHCKLVTKDRDELIFHYTLDHYASDMGACGLCDAKFYSVGTTRKHLKDVHKISKVVVSSKMVESGNLVYTVSPMAVGKGPTAAGKVSSVAGKAQKRKLSGTAQEPAAKLKKYGPEDVDKLPINPILDELVHCALCEFNTKVRLNMVRHLQFHAEQQPVHHTAPINPVPHLETHEKHFDKMVNLASSSAATRLAPLTPILTSQVTPEQAQFYPKLVPERQRYACGATDCSYISVNEELFKCHWNTLHPAADQFKCVHCSQNITFDTKTLAFSVIMDHLQMHDSTLYACKVCQFHHYKMDVVTKHCQDVHRGKAGTVVVREEVDASAVPKPGVSPAAPTMDLKPWQCGLCEFKSLIRKVIIDHCGKTHQSKMQFKCTQCPFRTSTLENVTKHMANSHPGKSDEVFYYYYKEGSIPSEDGVPKWIKQRQKAGLADTEIKTEASEPASLSRLLTAPQKPVTSEAPSPVVDLNIVKREVGEPSPEEPITVEGLCQKYGQFCEPNGLNYKCPLCKVVVEDTRNAMRSHLYEELAYRRWVCGTCSYKAFHSVGLNEHIISEHRGQNQSPVQLPPDPHIETWVSSLLDHQTSAIANNKESLAKQKILTERPAKPEKPEEPPKPVEPKVKPTMAELEKAFGPLGVPNNMVYCCPKCNIKIKDETTMRNHLESELTKIRWCCSKCAGTFQTYHEAQFHCKSAHAGQAARPREAERSPALRAAWRAAVLQVQKLSMRCLPLSGEPEPSEPTPATDDNSLLVVRYEERVPTPEETVLRSRPTPAPVPAVTPGPSTAQDSDDDERLVIDEAKKTLLVKCPHCDYQSKYPHVVNEHTYRHYNLKPYACIMCAFTGHKSVLQNHVEAAHGLPYTVDLVRKVEIPSGPPVVQHLTKKGESRLKKVEEEQVLVCLVCEKSLTDQESNSHSHPTGRPATFVRNGKVIFICQVCSTLWPNVPALRRHFVSAHPGKQFSYEFYKLKASKETYCGHCSRRFNSMRQLNDHNAIHAPLPLKATNVPQSSASSCIVLDDDDDEAGPSKRPAEEGTLPPLKRIAKKSTTKLPTQSVAKKSTTKLPYNAEESDSDGEFSFYGSKPTPLQEYRNVTTLMSFCNTTVPFTMDKLSGVLKINPRVVVQDVKKDQSGK